MILSMITPIHEISRSLHYTINKSRSEYIEEKVYSVSSPIDPQWKEICKNQFYARDIENNLFYLIDHQTHGEK